MMKDQTKKRTERHQDIKFDSLGNEYILGLNLPYVTASKKSANLFNINTFYNLIDDGINNMREIEQIIKNSDESNQFFLIIIFLLKIQMDL